MNPVPDEKPVSKGCVAAAILVPALIAALLVPAILKSHRQAKVVSCVSNLSQLWKMQYVYMSQFGDRKHMSPGLGAEFWLDLTRTRPPLVDETVRDIFCCPCRETNLPCDYRGPSRPVAELPDNGVVGGDRIENHSGEGGNILRKSGDILNITQPELEAVTTARP